MSADSKDTKDTKGHQTQGDGVPLAREDDLEVLLPAGATASVEATAPVDEPGSAPLTFNGGGGDECEDFIHAVHNRSRAQGQSHNNAWVIDLVRSSLTGAALRWYANLPRETQDDWVLLRQGLLRQYPPGQAHNSDGSIVDHASSPQARTVLDSRDSDGERANAIAQFWDRAERARESLVRQNLKRARDMEDGERNTADAHDHRQAAQTSPHPVRERVPPAVLRDRIIGRFGPGRPRTRYKAGSSEVKKHTQDSKRDSNSAGQGSASRKVVFRAESKGGRSTFLKGLSGQALPHLGSMSRPARRYAQLYLLPTAQTDVELTMRLLWGWRFERCTPPSRGNLPAGQDVGDTLKTWSFSVQPGGLLAKIATRNTVPCIQTETRSTVHFHGVDGIETCNHLNSLAVAAVNIQAYVHAVLNHFNVITSAIENFVGLIASDVIPAIGAPQHIAVQFIPQEVSTHLAELTINPPVRTSLRITVVLEAIPEALFENWHGAQGDVSGNIAHWRTRMETPGDRVAGAEAGEHVGWGQPGSVSGSEGCFKAIELAVVCFGDWDVIA